MSFTADSPWPGLDPTIGSEAAAAGRWQCAIIGAGPAGAAAALRLSRRGLDVLLIDAATMPRPKVCGCCLSPAAMRELRRLETLAGPTPLLGAAARPLAAVTLAAAGRRARIAMRGGGTLSREVLDASLTRAAVAAGSAWLPETRVTSIEETDSSVVILGRHGPHPVAFRADMVVIAGGLGAAIRIPGDRGRATEAGSRVGIGAVLPPDASSIVPGELVMAVARGGYCGLVRLEDGRLDLAAAIDRGALAAAGSPAQAVAAILGDALGSAGTIGIVAALAEATVRGTPPLTHATGPVAGHRGRILRIGDAAGYVEPFTGEGIGWALAGARLLDEAIGRHGPERPGAAAAAYAAAYRRRFATHHARCRAVAHAVRQPLVVHCAAAAARVLPGVAAGVLPIVVGAKPSGETAA